MTTAEPDAAAVGYDRLRAVIINAIETCPDGQADQLRQRIQQFAAGLEPDDLAILEQVISELNEGPDVVIERELAQLLADFTATRATENGTITPVT